METIKTYPPEVEAQRRACLEMIDLVKADFEARYTPPDNATATQIAAVRPPRTPEEFASVERSYREAIDPFLLQLARLEGFAQITFVLPAAHFDPQPT